MTQETETLPPDPREAALLCAQVAYEKKAEDIAILDVSRIIVITSYFVIASGETRKQLQAISDAIRGKLKALGFRPRGAEGYDEGRWILADYGEVVVQLFDRQARRYYDLETVWGDAPRVAFSPPAATARPSREASA